jgi:hypothetical protein
MIPCCCCNRYLGLFWKDLNPARWRRTQGRGTTTQTSLSPGLCQSGASPSTALAQQQYASFQPGKDRLPSSKHSQALWTATDRLSCQQNTSWERPRHKQRVDDRISTPTAAAVPNTVSSPGAFQRLYPYFCGSRCAAGRQDRSLLHLLLLHLCCCCFCAPTLS